MDRHGIEISMLSVSSPTVGFLKEPLARQRLARQVNEFTGDLAKRSPNSFGAFATLPLPDISVSLDELGYALEVLHLDGVVRRATLFVHPTSPPCLESVGLGHPAPILEFPMDTARTVTDLIFASTLTRYCDIQVMFPTQVARCQPSPSGSPPSRRCPSWPGARTAARPRSGECWPHSTTTGRVRRAMRQSSGCAG
jgi:hypothetical protein